MLGIPWNPTPDREERRCSGARTAPQGEEGADQPPAFGVERMCSPRDRTRLGISGTGEGFPEEAPPTGRASQLEGHRRVCCAGGS